MSLWLRMLRATDRLALFDCSIIPCRRETAHFHPLKTDSKCGGITVTSLHQANHSRVLLLLWNNHAFSCRWQTAVPYGCSCDQVTSCVSESNGAALGWKGHTLHSGLLPLSSWSAPCRALYKKEHQPLEACFPTKGLRLLLRTFREVLLSVHLANGSTVVLHLANPLLRLLELVQQIFLQMNWRF